MSSIQHSGQVMRSLDAMLAGNPWARDLTADQLQRVRAAIVVRDLEPGGHACHKGDPANAWVGVVKVDYRMIMVLDIDRLRSFGTCAGSGSRTGPRRGRSGAGIVLIVFVAVWLLAA